MTTTTRRLAGALATVLLAALPPTGGAMAAAAGTDGGSITYVHPDPRRDPVAALAAYARLMAVPSNDTGVVPDVRAPREGGGVACPPRRCSDFKVPVPRGVKVSDSTTRVIFPKGYDARRNAHKRYPVVFLWNGGQSTFDGWSFKTELTKMSRRWKAILVMPSGGFGKEAGFFSDWADGSADWETFHTKVVVPWVDRTFRTLKGARAAVGASMGGIGVFSYAAHNPGMFKSVLSISGAVDTTGMATYGVDPALNEALGYNYADMSRIWGDPILDRATWDAHNPTLLAPKLKNLRILIASGTGFAGTGDSGIYSGQFEQNLWNTHRTFLAALTASGIAYSARVAVGGVHDWPYFNDPLRWGVPTLIKAARGR